MRAVQTIVGIWLLSSLAIWIRGGLGFSILHTLPFVQRPHHLSPHYDAMACIALAMGAWGVLKLASRPRIANPPQTPNGRFRGELIVVPATVIVLAWITARVTPALGFNELIRPSPYPVENAYLAVLAVGVFSAVLAFRWLRNK